MFQRTLVAVALTVSLPAVVSPAVAQTTLPPSPMAPTPPPAPVAPMGSAAPEAPAPSAAPAVKLTPEQIAHDPRMIAALRHANNTADRKCGDVGGIISLEQKAAGRACRKRFVDAAKADAEFEINGGR